jgi:predicted peroxiredoxin
MKKILLFALMGLFSISCNQLSMQRESSEQVEEIEVIKEEVRDGVFIHITEAYKDPHRVLMPLKMAVLMAEDKDVLVYMDIDAVKLTVEGAEDLSFDGFDSFQTYIRQLMDKNVGVYACPSCLAVAGYTPDDLMDGIEAAQKEKFFNFTEGRIITLDY